MTPTEMEEAIRNLQLQADRIERFLPNLATRAELVAEIQDAKRHAVILNEATRDEIKLVAENLARVEATMATKAELRSAVDGVERKLRAAIGDVEGELRAAMGGVEGELRAAVGGVKEELRVAIGGVKEELRVAIGGVEEELKGAIGGVEEELKGAIGGLERTLSRQVGQVANQIATLAKRRKK